MGAAGVLRSFSLAAVVLLAASCTSMTVYRGEFDPATGGTKTTVEICNNEVVVWNQTDTTIACSIGQEHFGEASPGNFCRWCRHFTAYERTLEVTVQFFEAVPDPRTGSGAYDEKVEVARRNFLLAQDWHRGAATARERHEAHVYAGGRGDPAQHRALVGDEERAAAALALARRELEHAERLGTARRPLGFASRTFRTTTRGKETFEWHVTRATPMTIIPKAPREQREVREPGAPRGRDFIGHIEVLNETREHLDVRQTVNGGFGGALLSLRPGARGKLGVEPQEYEVSLVATTRAGLVVEEKVFYFDRPSDGIAPVQIWVVRGAPGGRSPHERERGRRR
jgi:hypothetical protein